MTEITDPLHGHNALCAAAYPSADEASSSAAADAGIFSDGFATLSRPIVLIDFVWNLAFIIVAVFVLLSTLKERPSTPLRLWLSGYAFQCALHVCFVCAQYGECLSPHETHHRWIKRLESANTIVSSMWWAFGFYWVIMGGQSLLQDSPHLYWLTVVFLVFDVFFVLFCIGVAFIVFFTLFCCIPLLAMIYSTVLRPEGASEDVIRNLPKHRYRIGSRIDVCSSSEFVIHPDDSECCICLSSYMDDEELRTLPCNHHFHSGCISRWLQINATCPLCKYDILRKDSLV